jgi:radical SAM superfamily enzyme YgiQ (UPF0313 family)
MARKLILVALNWTRDKDPRMPLGHASLLATLHQVDGLAVESVVRPVNTVALNPFELATDILSRVGGQAHKEVDIAIGIYVWAEEIVQLLLPALRRLGFGGRIILGGPQISYTSAGLETLYRDADVFVRGYGESALLELAQTPGRPTIEGVHYAGDVDLGAQGAVDLLSIPSPWITGAVPLHRRRFLRWETQRGCPFRCAFCQHREPGARLTKRDLSLDRVLSEVDLFCRNEVEEIAVLDPIFNVGPRATQILNAFHERNYRGRLSLQCRAEYVTDEFIEVARQLKVQLEFGLQTIHDAEGEAVQRRNHLPRVDTALAKVRSAGISHEVSLIFGLPRQTFASFLTSVQWCLERAVPVLKAFPLMLLRGTALDRQRDQWGLRERGYPMPVVIGSNTFDEADWHQMERVSMALKRSEGHHPRDVEALLDLAHIGSPDPRRWSPIAAESAAWPTPLSGTTA